MYASFLATPSCQYFDSRLYVIATKKSVYATLTAPLFATPSFVCLVTLHLSGANTQSHARYLNAVSLYVWSKGQY